MTKKTHEKKSITVADMGRRSAAALTPQQRSAKARKASQARWKRTPTEATR